MSRRALFLDRDGVINVDLGYVHKPEQVVFVDGIFDLVSEAKRLGYVVVVVTNQAGIGRGYYSEEDFHRLMAWMGNQFVQRGGKLDAVYFSPFHPEHGLGHYRRTSDCRKPAPGMIVRAKKELDLDLYESIIIGDKASDVTAGLAAEVGTIIRLRVDVPVGKHQLGSTTIKNLHEAVSFLSAPPQTKS